MTAPLDAIDAALQRYFGQEPSRASISFLGVDPVEVLRFQLTAAERAYLSLGMARHPMTAASAGLQQVDGPRAELMLRVRDGADQHVDVWRHVAMLAAAPAVEGVVYTAGMTLDLGRAIVTGSRCSGVVVLESPIGRIVASPGPVVVLEIVPATSTELAWCRVHGSAALLARWSDEQTDLLDLGRPAVALA
jgi:hypothetical protein